MFWLQWKELNEYVDLPHTKIQGSKAVFSLYLCKKAELYIWNYVGLWHLRLDIRSPAHQAHWILILSVLWCLVVLYIVSYLQLLLPLHLLCQVKHQINKLSKLKKIINIISFLFHFTIMQVTHGMCNFSAILLSWWIKVAHSSNSAPI